ncbi:hypothetical protein [Catelliglobosispora koreensis]|uniref:hypothetical protein n=1 Tax=Catelliglobosispora koreensis TaxID=129052 RepID=UPI00039FAA3F|nr:hypothetical protein [Catelliglobosispora koreensis]
MASIFAPAIFVLIDTGLAGIDSARAGSFTDDPFSALAALGALFLAGIIYGVLVMARLSPVGPGFAGLALMAISGWAVLDPSSYGDTLGTVNAHMGGAIAQLGLGMLLGAPLIATLTSPRRWRGEDNGDSEHDEPPPSTSGDTLVAPVLPVSKTLLDFVRARAAVPEPPPAPLDTAAANPLPNRIPMVPPAGSAGPRTDERS